MPRPRIMRRVATEPGVTYFKPAGVRMMQMEETVLTVDELEAIRLRDHEDMDQTSAAKRMGISQPTFQRLYESARKKIADALVNGKALRIGGGHYHFYGRGSGMGPAIGRRRMGTRMRAGRGIGRGRGMANDQ